MNNGVCTRIIGSTQDITERKKAQIELQETERKFRNVVEHSTNMFYQHDVHGVLSYVSPQSVNFLGYTPEDAKRNWQEFITDHPINKEGEKLTQKALETGKIQNPYELQLITKDNRIIWVEVHEAPLLEDKEVVGIVGSLTDITDRKQYEKQLKQSLERYDYVSKASRDAIYDWDITNDYLHWGEGFNKLFGHKTGLERYPIKNWAKLVHSDDIEETQRDLQFTLKDSSMDSWSSEYRFKKAEGGYAYVVENGYIIRNDDGKAIRMIGALRDVTESKRTEIQNEIHREIALLFKEQEILNPILEQVLEYLANYGKFSTAEIWLKSAHDTHLNLVANYARHKKGDQFYKLSKDQTKFEKGTGLPGMVWQDQKIHSWNNVGSKESFLRNKAAQKAGIKSAFGIPLFQNEELTGVLLLSSPHQASNSDQTLTLFEGLQDFLGPEIKRKQQEEEFQLLFESAPEILAVATPNGYFSRVNPAFCELLGYTEEELISEPLEKFLHPEDIEGTLKEYSETIRGDRQSDNFVNRYVTKSGETVYISWYSSEIFGEDGLFFAYGRDVTETLELEQLLQLTNRLAKVGSWELDLRDSNKKQRVYWSNMTQEIFEVPDNYDPNLSDDLEFFQPESREILKEAVQKAIDKGESYDLELEILSAKETSKWLRCIGSVEFANGKCKRLFGSIQDITEKKRAEIEIENTFKEKEMILESIGDAFFAVDHEWTVTYWNKEAENIVLKPRDEIIGKNLWDEYEDAVELKFYSEYHKAVEEQINVHFEEYYPGLEKWLEVSAYPSQNGLSVFFKDITERKAIEDKIKDTNEKLKVAQQIAKLGYWELKPQTGELFWSDEVYRIWGLEKNEDNFSLERFINTIHPDDLDEFNKHQDSALSGKEDLNAEHRIILKDGTIKWVHEIGSVHKNEDGEIESFQGTVQDITTKKNAELEVEETLREKETILESIEDGFFTINKNWVVTYWNRAAERMLHTPKKEILGQNLWDIFEDSVDLPSYTNYHRTMHQNINVDFEEYWPDLEKWFDISAYPSPDGISVFFKDISERRKNEEKIRRINERFEKVTEATNDAIWDFDVIEDDLFWGKGFETLFGYDPEEVNPTLEFLVSLIHPNYREHIMDKINKYMSDSTKSSWYEEYRFRKQDGSYAYVIDRANFIRNDKGELVRVVGAMTDLTNQKKYEENLKKLNTQLEERAKDLAASNEELEQFAYVASHDLQEPLRMVTSFLTQLDKKYSDNLDEKANEYIHYAVDGAQRMRQIILDLLNYSRLNKEQQKKEKTDLNKLLDDAKSLERSHIMETEAEIISDKLPTLKVNPGALKQVFQNLLNNAIKYHKSEVTPKVTIRAEELDTHWKFSYSDNGIGINEEFKDTIFQIFQRLHTRDRYSGTGIGLAISKKIIERHEGEIWVESEEGKGSTFHFTLKK